MDSNLRSVLLVKAVKLAALYLTIAIAGFLVLGLGAIYLPENILLRRSADSKLKEWLPGKEVIPPGMILSDIYKTTNEQVAENYPNRKEMLRLLDDWGREESYTNLYFSPDRCTTAGPRSIKLSVILHKDGLGAQQYLEWLRNRDQKKALKIRDYTIGNSGYQVWQMTEGNCAYKEEKQIDISFRRNNAQGVVSITGEDSQSDQLLEIAIRLAKILDENIQKRTFPQ